MDERGLEERWAQFIANDVTVEQFLAIDYWEGDNAEFVRLQQAAVSGSREEQARAADALHAMMRDSGSAAILDGVVGSALGRVDRHADALTVRADALQHAANWHPTESPRIVGNIGNDLLELGRIDEALRWYERALAWDPVNPFVIDGIASCYLQKGELPLAFWYRDHLAFEGYPADFSADFDALFASRGWQRPPQTDGTGPGLGALGTLTPRQYHRFCTACQFDRNQTKKERLRAHALATAMRGALDYALWCAGRSAAMRWEGFDSAEAVQLRWSHALNRAMHRFVAGRSEVSQRVEQALASGQFTSNDSPDDTDDVVRQRVAFLERAAAQGAPPEFLANVLHDPSPALRLNAARLLLPIAPALAVPYLEEVAVYERKKGADTTRPEDTGIAASHLLFALKRRERGAGRPLRVIPEEGIDHPLFATLQKDELLSLMLTLIDAPDAAMQQRIQAVFADVSKNTPWEAIGGKCDEILQFEDRTLHVGYWKKSGFFKSPKPGDLRGPARAVVSGLLAAGVPVTDVAIGRYPVRKGEPSLQALPDPRDVGTHEYDGWEQAFRVSFDLQARPPASEPESGLMMMVTSRGQYLPERRLARLYLQDLRICYGLPDVDYLPRDARSAEVSDAITRALDDAFGGVPPLFQDKDGNERTVAPITCLGKRGYGFAIQGQSPEFLLNYPGTIRYREYELMRAMRDVCGMTGLFPLVHWQRSRALYIVNVWER